MRRQAYLFSEQRMWLPFWLKGGAQRAFKLGGCVVLAVLCDGVEALPSDASAVSEVPVALTGLLLTAQRLLPSAISGTPVIRS